MTNRDLDHVKIRFDKFLELIANVLNSEKEITAIQNKLRRHFRSSATDYLCSDKFQLTFDSIEKVFQEQKKTSKYYSLLASFDDQLKKHSIKSAKSTHCQINPSPLPTTSIIEYEVSIVEVQETINVLLDQCCKIVDQTLVSTSTKSKHEEKILKLERRLYRLSKTIRKLEETEMSLDEMGKCDLYEVEANLKQQACFVYEKLTKLRSQSINTERLIEKKIRLNDENDYPLITKDLEDMINRSVDLPAFADVLNVVEEANKKYDLHLSEETQRKFAEKSFKVIGKEFKTRRMADFQDIMLSRLPEDFNIEQNDPALENEEIEQVLIANEREAVIKTEQIFEEYSKIEPDPENEVNTLESAGEESADEREQPVIQEMEHDAIDLIPPFSVRPLTPIASESDTYEISLNDRPITILSTASLPPKDQPTEKILIPRRQTATTTTVHNNETIYNLYKERLTNNHQSSTTSIRTKRSLPPENSLTKKIKQPDLIILD